MLVAVVEVYSNKWGPCVCFKQTLQKLYFANMDKMKCAALDHFDSVRFMNLNPKKSLIHKRK